MSLHRLLQEFRRGLVLLPAALVTAATVPAAADPERWSYFVQDGHAFLEYGTPDSDDTLLALSCDPARGTWRIVAFLDSKGVEPGGPATLILSAGGRSATLTGKGQSDEMNGIVDVVVQGKIDAAAMAVLTENAPLTAAVPGAKLEIDPSTMGDKASRFVAACRKK